MAFIFDKDNEYGARIIGDGGESTDGVLKVTTGANTVPALAIGRTVAGNASQAAFKLLGSSNASGALMGFVGAISLTSVVLTSVANIDYVIPVELNGEARYIPVLKAAALIGAAV
jgi:hypothetical protein